MFQTSCSSTASRAGGAVADGAPSAGDDPEQTATEADTAAAATRKYGLSLPLTAATAPATNSPRSPTRSASTSRRCTPQPSKPAMGDFTMVLDPAARPRRASTTSWCWGATGAFDGTLFHRIIAGLRDPRWRRRTCSTAPAVPATNSPATSPKRTDTGSAQLRWPTAGNPATNGSQFFVITGRPTAPRCRLCTRRSVTSSTAWTSCLAIEGVPRPTSADAPVDEVVVRQHDDLRSRPTLRSTAYDRCAQLAQSAARIASVVEAALRPDHA